MKEIKRTYKVSGRNILTDLDPIANTLENHHFFTFLLDWSVSKQNHCSHNSYMRAIHSHKTNKKRTLTQIGSKLQDSLKSRITHYCTPNENSELC